MIIVAFPSAMAVANGTIQLEKGSEQDYDELLLRFHDGELAHLAGTHGSM
jgi:hypothetical protein